MPTPKANENKADYLKRCTIEVMGEGKDRSQAYAMCNSYWDQAKGKKSLSLSAPLQLANAPDEPTKPQGFLITAYTGQIVRDYWGDDLIISLPGIKTASDKIPILRQHERDRVVGFSDRVWVEGNNLLISGQFSQVTEDAKEVQGLAQEGYPWQASMGIWPGQIRYLTTPQDITLINGQTLNGPLTIWETSEVREVSFVSLGADKETAAIMLADINQAEIPADKGESMPITMETLQAENPELLRQIRESALGEGIKQERDRVCELLKAQASPEATLQAITNGLSMGDAFKAFYEAEKAVRAQRLEEMAASASKSMGSPPPQDGATYEQKVAEIQATEKVSKGQAMKLAVERFPALHEAYIERVNAQRGKK